MSGGHCPDCVSGSQTVLTGKTVICRELRRRLAHIKKIMPVMAVIGAGVLWGIISLFIRSLSAGGLDAMQITLIRLAVAAPALTAAVALMSRKKLRIRLRDIWMFAGTGIVSIVLFNICYFHTMIKSQASVAVVLLYTSPVFIMLMSALFFRERITAVKLAAVAMTFGGCVLVAGLSGGSDITPGILLTGLASGLFYGLYTIFGRVALRRYDSLTVTVWTFILGFLGALPVSRPAATVSTAMTSGRLVLLCLGIGLVCTVLPYFLYTWGLSRMESSKAAVLVSVEPLVGAVLGMTAYGEDRSPMKIAGIALILGAMMILNLPEREHITGKGAPAQ